MIRTRVLLRDKALNLAPLTWLGNPRIGVFFIIVRLSVAKRTLRSNLVRFGCGNTCIKVFCATELCEVHTSIEPYKVRLQQQPHYDYIIIEELLYFREYFFQLSCLLDYSVSALDHQFFYRI